MLYLKLINPLSNKFKGLYIIKQQYFDKKYCCLK